MFRISSAQDGRQLQAKPLENQMTLIVLYMLVYIKYTLVFVYLLAVCQAFNNTKTGNQATFYAADL